LEFEMAETKKLESPTEELESPTEAAAWRTVGRKLLDAALSGLGASHKELVASPLGRGSVAFALGVALEATAVEIPGLTDAQRTRLSYEFKIQAAAIATDYVADLATAQLKPLFGRIKTMQLPG
jgi:hypothetical protein